MAGYIVGVVISLIIMSVIFGWWFYLWIKKNSKENELAKKGKLTEKSVNEKLALWANINNSLFIEATMFKYDKNKIFEVDGILLTTRALICVEIKNINAEKIYGNGNEKEWVKVTGKNKHMIKSPILQNDRHIEHIIKMTNIKMPIISLIIFDAISCKELDIENVPSHVLVRKSNEIDETLKSIESALIPKISKSEIEKMYESLMQHQTTDKKDRELLVSFAKEYNEKTFTI